MVGEKGIEPLPRDPKSQMPAITPHPDRPNTVSDGCGRDLLLPDMLVVSIPQKFGGRGWTQTSSVRVQTESALIDTTRPPGDRSELNTHNRSHNPAPNLSATVTLATRGRI